MGEIVRQEPKPIKSPVKRLLESVFDSLKEMRQVFESDARRMDVLGKRPKSPQEAIEEMDRAREYPRQPREF